MATIHSGRHRAPQASSRPLKIIGSGVLLLPVAVLAALAIGDMSSNPWAVIELLPGAPLLLLARLGWRRPHLGGWILVGGSLVLGALWTVWTRSMVYGSVSDWKLDREFFAGVLVLFVLPLVAGALFLLAARGEHPRAADA